MLRLVRAEDTDANLKIILSLVDGARGWLAGKGTDQWSKPWPSRRKRNARIRRGLSVGATWIVWDEETAVATVTVARSRNAKVWRGATINVEDEAIYAHRLIIDRRFAGWGLGEQLIDWTGRRAQLEYGAEWIRIDVWTMNKGLHEYYQKRGFEPCGKAPDPKYPSGMLFQKPVSAISWPTCPLFIEPEPGVSLFGQGTAGPAAYRSRIVPGLVRWRDRIANLGHRSGNFRISGPAGGLVSDPAGDLADDSRVPVGT
jgi:GNAT superfamily N-acetyltransferase